MHDSELLQIMSLLGVSLIFAKLLGGIFHRLGLPVVLSELVTGIIAGNLVIGDIGKIFSPLESSEIIKAFSEFGILMLLFVVGLETSISELKKVGKEASFVAIIGVVAPFLFAFMFIPFVSELKFEQMLFISATLTATSVGITARVLKDVNTLRSVSGKIILGAALIDDILGILILSIVSAIVVSGFVTAYDVSLILVKMLAFGFAMMIVRWYLLPKILIKIRPLEVSGTITVLLFSLVMIFAWGSEMAGLAGIIGAFALGVVLEDIQFKGYHEKKDVSLHKLIKPITDFLSPIFFIYTGMSVKINTILNADAIIMSLTLITIGIIGKLLCGLGVGKKSSERGADRLLIGFGMIPRGEVGLIFASVGHKLKILNEANYAAVIAMVAVTTFIAPILIGIRTSKKK